MKNRPFFGDSKPFEYKWYRPERKVLGKRMSEHLRFAVCYWHSFVWQGLDPFGGDTFQRPWHAAGGDALKQAMHKADVAFELFRLLNVPFFTFHDRDIAPEGATLRESNANVRRVGEVLAKKMSKSGVKLLWGTANLFTNRRYMSGAATNPDPEVFAYAAAQVKNVLELTHELNGANYVLWGGREGYETLLNTDVKRELDQLGRFLTLVVEHKHKIGFKGLILIEPKPGEPTKHQYDYDVATVYGFLKRYGLEREVKVNIEQNHALLAGHTFEHEIAMAQAFGIFGSIDMNRGDEQLGWDTDQFPNNLSQMALALYHIVKGGGFTTGGLNFDAKVRRQSIDPDDLLHAHAEAMDLCARALLVAEKMIHDDQLGAALENRYAGWKGKLGREIMSGKKSLGTARRAGGEGRPRAAGALRPPGAPRGPGQPLHLEERPHECPACRRHAVADRRRRGGSPGRARQGELVGVSWSNFQEERWKKDEAAIRAALEAAGAKYVSADAQGSNEKQLADVEALIAKGREGAHHPRAGRLGHPPGGREGQGSQGSCRGLRSPDPGRGRPLSHLRQRRGRPHAGARGAGGEAQGQLRLHQGLADGPECGLSQRRAARGAEGGDGQGRDQDRGRAVHRGMVARGRAEEHGADPHEKRQQGRRRGGLERRHGGWRGGGAAGAEHAGRAGFGAGWRHRGVEPRGQGGADRVGLEGRARAGQGGGRLRRTDGLGHEARRREGSETWSGGAKKIPIPSVFLKPLPITKDNLDMVIRAGWATKAQVCAGVTGAKAPAACK
jgi:xylose isomerase